MTFDTLKVRKNPDCPVCSEHPTLTELIDYEQFCGVPAHDRSTFDDNAEVKPIPAIGVKALKDSLDNAEELLILDVRETHELDISKIEGAIHIPKGEVLNRLDEIPRDVKLIVQCRTGVRSGDVVRWLQEHDYDNAYNLVGGINAWARQIDPTLPIY